VGDIFREIDEELRQDRYAKLWQDYGKYVIGAAVAVVFAVAGYRGWDYYLVSTRQAESAQFDTAKTLLRQGRKGDAAALFAAMGETGGAGYAALARFHQAALRADSGDAAGAILLYNSLAADDSVTGPLRQGAVVLSAMHAMDAAGTDRTALAGRLEALVEDGGPWRHSANELLGVLALQSGDSATARERFKRVADDVDAPAGIRARAAEVLAVLGK